MTSRKLVAAATALLVSTGVACANTITVNGSYTVTYTPSVGNGPSISYGLNHNGFTENLTLGVASPQMNFFTATPNGSCGTGCGANNNTASGTLTVTFSFTQPSGATGNLTETGIYQAKYSGSPLSCTTSPGPQTDCINWSGANDPIVVHFSNGDTLDVTLYNAQDWAITPKISFDMVNVPGPIAGAGLPGLIAACGGLLGWSRRRKKHLRPCP
jgi:hypothetical protein